MNNLEYSSDAFKARSLFYGNPIVYVEGKDDIPFWYYVFNRIGFKCTIEELGGIDEVLKRMATIESDETHQSFAAIDGDYRKYNNKLPNSDAIFITPSYGIENMMFCQKRISDLLFSYIAKHDVTYFNELLKPHLDKFKSKFFKLSCMDVLNYITDSGQEILPTTFARFYDRTKFLSEEQIKFYEQECADFFSAEDLKKIQNIETNLNNNFFYDIKCHFFESFFLHLIRHIIKDNSVKQELSNKAIRSMLLNCTCDKPCEIFEMLYSQIKSKLAKLKYKI